MRALISVSDKTNLIELVSKLHKNGVELISTGGTQKIISEYGIPVKNISEITGFPEILDGRVKTLHPKVHGGLLAKSNKESHKNQMVQNDIERIDFVIVNLYPFKETLIKSNVTFEECIENIDIGGPSMLRSASKNYEDVIVLCDPNDYITTFDKWVTGNLSLDDRKGLAAKVFRHTASYDSLIANYLTEEIFPEKLTITFEKKQDLRYGENPHQSAAFYKNPIVNEYSITNANQLHGKELSYNNIQDANSAISLLNEFDEICAVAVKHSNPCGVGIGSTVLEAFTNCYNSDSVSIFGGIVAINDTIDKATAESLSNIFLEIIIAPNFSDEAFEILSKKKNIRLLQLENNRLKPKLMFSNISGGLLIQECDNESVDMKQCKVVTKKQPSSEDLETASFLWKVVKHVKSNAIVVGNNKMTLGIGVGQMNRVGSAKIALEQERISNYNGNVLVSDAFFPMRDTVDLAAKYGISTIVQTGGSIKDEEVIKAADENNISMIFTGVRHFKH